MTALATFVRFRLYFSAGSDPAHASTASQFTDDLNATATPAWGQYLQNVFEMQDGAGSFSTRERGMFGIHWINTTSGSLDTSWITADYTAVESAVQTFFTAIAGYVSTSCRLVEHRWYPFGPGVTAPNPPSRVATIATPIVGTGSGQWVHQQASTVTLRTSLRKHWGRMYLPITAGPVTTGGQYTTAFCDAVGNAARTMLTGPGTSQGVVPVVWSRSKQRAYGITDIEVDSVPDIIRRRRPRSTNYRKIVSS